MARKDKKNRKCIYCEKTFASPQKLQQHYKSNKNQCTSSPPSHNITRPQSPDQILEQAPIPQVIDQEDDPEAGSGPSTQAYREGEPSEVEQQDAQEGKYIDRYARKPREHLKT